MIRLDECPDLTGLIPSQRAASPFSLHLLSTKSHLVGFLGPCECPCFWDQFPLCSSISDLRKPQSAPYRKMSTYRSSGHYCHPLPSLETPLSPLSTPGIVYLVKGILSALTFSQWTKQNSRQWGLLINLPDSLLFQVQKYSPTEKSLEYKILSLPLHLHCMRCPENPAVANGTN